MTIKGADKLSYIFKEEDSRKEMSKALKMLMLKKYDGKVIYMHNGSKFDFTFILDALADLGKVDILMRKDNKILQVKWTFNTINPITEKPHSKPSKIIFYDSFNILDASLARLAQTFKVDHQKDIFAHDWCNSGLFDPNYVGPVPAFQYFNVPRHVYDKYCLDRGGIWDYKEELRQYCLNDCICLREIIIHFGNLTFNTHKVDITKRPTISSMTYQALRVNALPEDKIVVLNGVAMNTVKQAYYGGISEAYIPQGRVIKSFDVNSLYPSVMRDEYMPVGQPWYFTGDPINLGREDMLFGFWKCKVWSPKGELLCPPMVHRIMTELGMRSLTPLGNWEATYFSPYILYMQYKYGYRFEVLGGIAFQKEKIFASYIDPIYASKASRSSDDPMRYVDKAFLNNLYGRFGLIPTNEKTRIVSPLERGAVEYNS